jgi:uncharacterized protein YutE (UPF0331/DUF86 family)
MDFDMAKIRSRVQFVEANLAKLEQLRTLTYAEFEANPFQVEAAKYLFQTAIEALLDACTHIAARLRLKTPSEGAELIRLLEKEGLLPKEHASTYVQMVKFRNLLVHLYQEVDNRRVYDIIQNELGDLRLFIADVWHIVQKKSP